MLIGVDGNEANVEKKVGVSVYTYSLLKYFKKKSSSELKFKIYLKNRPKDLPVESAYYKYEIVPGNFLWSQIFLPWKLYQEKIKPNVFFSPAHYIPRFCPVPAVVTIHDLSYIFYPEDFLKKDLYQLKSWTKYSLKKAEKVIAVSKTTKKDIIKQYYLPDEKIDVIYNGYEKKPVQKSDIFRLKIEDKPYILYVGTIQPRKNIDILITAFSKFKQLYPEFQLIIAGKKGWMFEGIFEKVADLGLENEVFFTDFITDNQLVFLYKNAFCLVLPSFYEGFGIPLLEAMNFSCPVISSFASSLPEIGGDAALYFDPKNSYDLVEKLKILKEDKKLVKELVEKGKKRVKDFSWEKCADQTLEVIKSVAINS